MNNPEQILSILLESTNAIKNRQRVLAVFDIDSTLFDVTPRLFHILLDFAHDEEMKQKFPDQCAKLINVETASSDWGIENALKRAGLNADHPAFQDAIHEWWKSRFFSNDYLKYDQPYDGAIAFVDTLIKIGVEVYYLTGRDIHRMGESALHMRNAGFVVSSTQGQLILKPHKSMNDARFKTDWFHQKKSEQFALEYFFENEPVNINLLKKERPEVRNIFFKSTHSGKEEAPLDIPHIMDYLCHHITK